MVLLAAGRHPLKRRHDTDTPRDSPGREWAMNLAESRRKAQLKLPSFSERRRLPTQPTVCLFHDQIREIERFKVLPRRRAASHSATYGGF